MLTVFFLTMGLDCLRALIVYCPASLLRILHMDLDSITVICNNTVMKTEEQALSLDELSDEVGQLLTKYALLGAQQDNRVSQVPDARTIRYYTTLGLIDRPRINGRQAVYGRRQVLQVLAIKALQAINLPLSEIQTRLYGRDDAELEALLASLADFWKQKEQDSQKKTESVRTVTWHEIEIEPGVKVLIQDGWQSDDISETSKKISAALEAMRSRNKK